MLSFFIPGVDWTLLQKAWTESEEEAGKESKAEILEVPTVQL